MQVLIGHTGFVGKNLCEQTQFDLLFNSSNIKSFKDYDLNGSNIYLSCLPATKWLIDKDYYSKTQDFKNMKNIIDIIKSNKYNNVILISTIDVYADLPVQSDEDFSIKVDGLGYGKNRAVFEKIIQSDLDYNKAKIIRLPAVFGSHLKKNALFDMINNNNVEKINLNSYYQWFNIQNLYSKIEESLINDEVLFNFFSEPVKTSDIAQFFDDPSIGFLGESVGYDYRTKHHAAGYMYSEKQMLNEIESYINDNRN